MSVAIIAIGSEINQRDQPDLEFSGIGTSPAFSIYVARQAYGRDDPMLQGWLKSLKGLSIISTVVFSAAAPAVASPATCHEIFPIPKAPLLNRVLARATRLQGLPPFRMKFEHFAADSVSMDLVTASRARPQKFETGLVEVLDTHGKIIARTAMFSSSEKRHLTYSLVYDAIISALQKVGAEDANAKSYSIRIRHTHPAGVPPFSSQLSPADLDAAMATKAILEVSGLSQIGVQIDAIFPTDLKAQKWRVERAHLPKKMSWTGGDFVLKPILQREIRLGKHYLDWTRNSGDKTVETKLLD